MPDPGIRPIVAAATAVLLLAAVPGAPVADEEKAERHATIEYEVEGQPVIRLLPPDAIPAIDGPEMITAAEADAMMSDDEPVLGVFDGVSARAYSTWVLDGHEIVNDTLGGRPIAATW